MPTEGDGEQQGTGVQMPYALYRTLRGAGRDDYPEKCVVFIVAIG